VLLPWQVCLVPANNALNMCRSHYIDWFIKELGIDNSLGNPIYDDDIYQGNHGQSQVSLVFLLNIILKEMKCIFLHFTGFLNCTSVLTNNIILLRALPMFNETSCLNYCLCMLSALWVVQNGLHSYCDTNYSKDGVSNVDSEKFYKSVE
jgi:hypothetical protein